MATKDRLSELFKKIEERSVKQIIAQVVSLEREYRMSSKENFPRQKIRDLIDAEARLSEIKGD